MYAIAYQEAGPIDRQTSLNDITLPQPVATGHDLLVQVHAVSVNPVDTKVRRGVNAEAGQWKVLGWDASGTVVGAGPDVRGYAVGDEVFYAGSLIRPGTNSEYHLVDERIVGRKPSTLSHAEAAALPLTAITAWESLFDRLDVARPVAGGVRAILIIGGAGGVASLAIQLARQLTDLTVIATASRAETREWVKQMGAHHVIDHTKPLADQVAALGIGAPEYVFSTNQTHLHLSEINTLIAPQGRIALIDDPDTLDIKPLKRKSLSIHWELMYTRPIYGTADIAKQRELLDQVSKMVDAGTLRTTLTETLSPINAANLKKAHALVESNTMRGKVVLEGWPTSL